MRIPELLCWAAGNPAPLSGAIEFDEAELLNLVDLHALAGRFLRRLDFEHPSWASPALRSGLEDQLASINARLESHVQASAEIAGRLPDPSDVVLVKGISVFAVTGAPHTKRCGDIDLVCADADRLLAVLADLGYRRTRQPFLHEVGEFTSGMTEIDVHAYYPVYGYGGALRDADLDPAAHPGRWNQDRNEMALARIEHGDIRATARLGALPAGVFVPDASILAIMLSAHMFMNFTNMWSISHRPKPYVRLAELSDLTDLAASDSFDAGRFRSLVDRYGAGDAVAWARWASLVLLESDPLPGPAVTAADHRFPRCLWWQFWACLPIDSDSLVRTDWYDMAGTVAALDGNPVTVTAGAPTQVSVGELSRVLQLVPAARPASWELSIARSGDRLEVAIKLPLSPEPGERIRVDFGCLASEWATGLINPNGSDAPVETIAEGHRRVSFLFPWDWLARGMAVSGDLALLVGRASLNDSDTIVAGDLVPLLLRFA
jgi:hypothetical protein